MRALAVAARLRPGARVTSGTRAPRTALADLVGLVLVYGTGHPVGDERWNADRPDRPTLVAAVEAARRTSSRDEMATRTALWSRVREPIARALRIVGTLKPEYVADLAAQAETVCGLCGLDWQKGFLGPAAESLPEPRSWKAA